jgi:hypothetical protein
MLFCLAISDYTIVNVQGNLDSRAENILELCHQRMETLEVVEGKKT